MTEIKQGMMKYYHRGLLSKKWKEYKFILYDSSLLTWYSDVKHKKPDGMVLLKDVQQYICVGPYTKFLPDFPHLDSVYDEVGLIAFPMSVKNRDRDLVWLLCDELDDLNSWMKAIVGTLPSRSLSMEKLTNVSAPYIDEVAETISESNTSENDDVEPTIVKIESIEAPLSAGLIAMNRQGHIMNTKKNPLEKAGYDYGNNEWGTGDGWGYSSSSNVPGFAGLGGSGSYAPHIDLIHDEEAKKQEEYGNVDEAVEEITYEVSNNQIEDEEDVIPEYHLNTIDRHED